MNVQGGQLQFYVSIIHQPSMIKESKHEHWLMAVLA